MKALCTFLAVVLTVYIHAQNVKLYEIPEFQKAVKNETRTRTGEPGSKYWQNHADYTLKVLIDTAKNVLQGSGSIVYHNNSPETLREFHIRLYQDVYKTGTARNFPTLAEDINAGTTIDSLNINGRQYILFNKPANRSIVNRFCTDLYVRLSDSVMSGGSCVIELAWSFMIPASRWTRRMGRYSDDFFIGQWYPQVAVYDDVLGWDNLPHFGIQEFYNDFNNYDVTIKVPKDYMVWATGECDNLADVLDQNTINNLNKAKTSDSYITIIDAEANKTKPNKGNTWHFKAKHVPDFAFAAATHYLWYGTSFIADKQTGRRVFVDIAYPEESSIPPNSLQVARDALLWTSESFPGIPYPYSHATSFFNDLRNDVSMEYPMIANDGIDPDAGQQLAAMAHELFHNYMPFYVGFDETIFGWLDEGWVNFLESRFDGDGYAYLDNDIATYPYIAGSIYDRPLFSSTMDESIFNRRFLSYVKPAVNLMLLEELMGKEGFSTATKDFINVWKGKHPTPYDFFNTFMKYAEGDISWFLKVCYFEYGYADLGIESLSGNKITIIKKGNIPVSIRLEITFDDNSTEKIYKNLKIWETGTTTCVVNCESNKTIKKVVLGDSSTPDVDMSDNMFQR